MPPASLHGGESRGGTCQAKADGPLQRPLLANRQRRDGVCRVPASVWQGRVGLELGGHSSTWHTRSRFLPLPPWGSYYSPPTPHSRPQLIRNLYTHTVRPINTRLLTKLSACLANCSFWPDSVCAMVIVKHWFSSCTSVFSLLPQWFMYYIHYGLGFPLFSVVTIHYRPVLILFWFSDSFRFGQWDPLCIASRDPPVLFNI